MGHKLATPVIMLFGHALFWGKLQNMCYNLAVNTLLAIFAMEIKYCFVNMLPCGNGVPVDYLVYLQTLKVSHLN